MNEEELARAREQIDNDPLLQMKINAARQSEATRTYEVEECPHFGVIAAIGSTKAKWCPDCFRLFPDGDVRYGDQRAEGKWVMICPPFVMDQFQELLEEDEDVGD